MLSHLCYHIFFTVTSFVSKPDPRHWVPINIDADNCRRPLTYNVTGVRFFNTKYMMSDGCTFQWQDKTLFQQVVEWTKIQNNLISVFLPKIILSLNQNIVTFHFCWCNENIISKIKTNHFFGHILYLNSVIKIQLYLFRNHG